MTAASAFPHAVFGLLTLGSCAGRFGSIAVYRRKTGLGLPGGWVLPGESPETALARKLGAELRLTPVLSERTGLPSFPEPKILRELYETVIDSKTIRTYEVEYAPEVLSQINDWSTPDELIEAQAKRVLAHYNLSVLLAAGMPLSALGESAWIAALSSGTMRDSADKSFARELYLHERTALELGPEWEAIPPSRIARGKALAMGDCPQWTEALWFARHTRFAGPESLRLMPHVPEWVVITTDDGVWEGLAIIAEPRGLHWWPAGRVAGAQLARWKDGKWV